MAAVEEDEGGAAVLTLVAEILRGAWETVRETLPGDEREGAVFIAAMAWSFALFWTAVFVASYCSGAR